MLDIKELVLKKLNMSRETLMEVDSSVDRLKREIELKKQEHEDLTYTLSYEYGRYSAFEEVYRTLFREEFESKFGDNIVVSPDTED